VDPNNAFNKILTRNRFWVLRQDWPYMTTLFYYICIGYMCDAYRSVIYHALCNIDVVYNSAIYRYDDFDYFIDYDIFKKSLRNLFEIVGEGELANRLIYTKGEIVNHAVRMMEFLDLNSDIYMNMDTYDGSRQHMPPSEQLKRFFRRLKNDCIHHFLQWGLGKHALFCTIMVNGIMKNVPDYGTSSCKAFLLLRMSNCNIDRASQISNLTISIS
jgi:hypothetical protein